MPTPAYLLVAHGSRDPRPAKELSRLAQQVAAGLALTSRPLAPAGDASYSSIPPDPANLPLVATAFLELQPEPLHQQILAVSEQAMATGYDELYILPLFLLPGVHVMEDIPAEVAIAQSQLRVPLALHLCDHFGCYSQLSQKLRSALPDPSGQRILLSHGSRRPGGNAPIEVLAKALDAVPAFWSVEPDLNTQVEQQCLHQCLDNGQTGTDITIIPYFLFSSGITDAIAQQKQELATQFPGQTFHVLPPLSQSFPLDQWIVDWMMTDVLSQREFGARTSGS
ncbi:MAG: sirohydrochlorin chelatase [Cyanobacteria bacterium J06638_22]